MNENSEKLVVHTPYGDLVAYPSIDLEHPGIYIDLVAPGTNAGISIASVEYSDENRDGISTKVWKDALSEDYTDKLEHKHVFEVISTI